MISNYKTLLATVSLILLSILQGCEKEDIQYKISPNTYSVNLPLGMERYMYVDGTDTLYNSIQGKNAFSKYLRRYGFTGVYMYSTSGIVSSSSNYTSFGNFLKQLNDSGVIYRAVASGSATTFTSTGNITRYNSSQTDPAAKINRANLELEWWNGVCTWNTWNTTYQQVAIGSIPDNDF